MIRPSVLLLGHGSRDAAANAELEALVAAYRRRRPELEVAHGYIELADPPFGAALRDLARRSERVVVVPLFLLAAGHVKHDIPQVVASARADLPGARVACARALGVQPRLVELAVERARAALADDGDGETAVVFVGRGSSDPDANSDLCKVARLFGEGRDFRFVIPAFAGVTRPSFVEAAELVAAARPARLLVVPYFLFAGRLVKRLVVEAEAFAARHPGMRVRCAAHLGLDDRVLALLDERLAEVDDA